MQSFLVFAALLSFHQVVQSTPQFFGQSFASSSIVKPDGQAVSNSLYTDSLGNRVVNGKVNSAAAKPIPVLITVLIPPPLPGEKKNVASVPSVITPTSLPVTKLTTKRSTPTTKRQTTTRSTSTTVKITAPPATEAARTTSASTSIKTSPQPTRTTTLPAKRPTPPFATKRPAGSKKEGFYVHDNRGTYKPDDRGKYRQVYNKQRARKLL